ncbi:MAG: hypothetical protein ABIP99_01425 [Ilumatobacteraceae bacterium]
MTLSDHLLVHPRHPDALTINETEGAKGISESGISRISGRQDIAGGNAAKEASRALDTQRCVCIYPTNGGRLTLKPVSVREVIENRLPHSPHGQVTLSDFDKSLALGPNTVPTVQSNFDVAKRFDQARARWGFVGADDVTAEDVQQRCGELGRCRRAKEQCAGLVQESIRPKYAQRRENRIRRIVRRKALTTR